ncbi:CRTAC1 family protein [Dyadobacter diqingensis]|uniref:CRTAC1 family protein n=1 Tax=Dyadobacter diqingensis TaxID=2938121 RepID=UPI0020C463F1|nr:CRTAC1 family protein [Dyadobacter diqingensis]
MKTTNKASQVLIFIGSGKVFLIAFCMFLFSCGHEKENEEKMISVLNEINNNNFNKLNPFCPEAELAFYASVNSNNIDAYRGFVMKHQSAIAYLKMGEEQKAVDILEKIVPLAEYQFTTYAELVKGSLGIANMRLGERQNCVRNHTSESCLIPIVNTGIHTIRTGSNRAIEVYSNILKKNPEDYEARWLLNIAYMTLGEYPANVPSKWLIEGLNQDPTDISIKPFEDIAPQLGLNKRNRAGGVVIEDLNNDGHYDIVTSDWGLDGSMHYFKGNGDGTFTDISAKSGLERFKGGLNMIQADYNNDGFIDILVLRGAWMAGDFGKQPNSLFRNNGDDTFTDVTIQSGLFSLHPTQAGVWRDFNNDGWLDLFIGNESAKGGEQHGCELYLSDRNGKFTDVGLEAGCDVNAFIKGVAAADYNNDGFQDIFISTMSGYKVLLKNKGVVNGKLKFEDVSEISGVGNIGASTFPTWFWDYDNDGWQDIFVCGYQMDKTLAYSVATDALGIPNKSSKMYLYRNNHDGTFKNVSEEAGLNHSVFAMGSNFGDIDNDGYLDMYLGTGNPDYTSLIPNKLYKNIDGKRFADVTISGRVGNLQKGHGVAFSDMDNDGDQDIFIEVGGAYKGDAYNNSLYMNPGQNANNWIKLALEGTKSNRSAIGAKIKISFKENGVSRAVYRDLNSGGSFGASPLRREIGIGKAAIIDEIAVTWVGEKQPEIFRNVKPNQLYKITEGEKTLEPVKLKKFAYKALNTSIPVCDTPKIL